MQTEINHDKEYNMGAVKDGQTWLFMGDSITDVGRRGNAFPLGDGYALQFTQLMTARYPECGVSYINKGIGGNRITDLDGRWEDDCARHKPDWLSILIGINDLHSVLRNADDAVTPEVFRTVYDSVLKRTVEGWNPNILILSPFFISKDFGSTLWRGQVLDMLPDYIAISKELSEKYGTRYVDLQEIFQKHLKFRDADTFCPEPVHPNREGHLVIADAMLNAIAE